MLSLSAAFTTALPKRRVNDLLNNPHRQRRVTLANINCIRTTRNPPIRREARQTEMVRGGSSSTPTVPALPYFCTSMCMGSFHIFAVSGVRNFNPRFAIVVALLLLVRYGLRTDGTL